MASTQNIPCSKRAIAAQVPFAWFTADEAYGQNRGLRDWLERQDIAYVMATRCGEQVPAGPHTTTRVDQLIATVCPRDVPAAVLRRRRARAHRYE